MKTTPAYSCICQDCDTVFKIDETMINVINLDEDNDVLVKFLTTSLNKITCPHCGVSFTYEIPVVLFSVTDGIAIKVEPRTPAQQNPYLSTLPYFFREFPFVYRQVTYLIEGLEKYRIHKDGLDDRFIEYVKLMYFSDNDATPMEEINLCYKSSTNEKLYFEKLDYNGKLIKEYEILKTDIFPCSFKALPPLLWHQINRHTIRNYIHEEEFECQN